MKITNDMIHIPYQKSQTRIAFTSIWTWKVMFLAVKLAAHTVMVALFKVEPVLLLVSLYVIIVEFRPTPCNVMKGFDDGIVTFSLYRRSRINSHMLTTCDSVKLILLYSRVSAG